MPNVTIPANYMQDGRVLRLTLRGRWSASGANTHTWAVRWGGVSGTVLCTTPASVYAAHTNAQFKFEADIQTRTNGSTGTVFAQGSVLTGTATLPTMGTVTQYGMIAMMGSAGIATPAAVTVDLTADTALSVTLDPGTSSATDGATGHIYLIESLN